LSSREEAREYRVQVLRDYALLAAGEEDIPLSRFAGRQDPATRTVGYGKAMFVFHMARQRMGDGSFWTALEEIYRTRLFKETSWRAFAESFAANSHWTGKEADRFFDQWVTRTGAPILGLDNVSMVHEGDTWGVKGTLLQEKPLYDLEVPVVLETEHGSQKQSVNIAGRSRSFSFNIKSRPVRLTVDPESHVFRLLNGEEIPATINTVKGAQTLTVVVSSNFDRKWLPLVKSLLIVLNQEGAPVVSEQDLGGVPKGNLLFVGYPENQSLGKLLSRLPESSFSSKGFLFQGYAGEAGDGLFAYLKENGRVSALFLPEEGSSLEEVEEMIRKITHYGTYSYLVFKQTEVAAKGRWEPESSPLTIELGEMQ
ncbi:MAG: M1 family peptidase, partial [Desulfovibrionales bacterium]